MIFASIEGIEIRKKIQNYVSDVPLLKLFNEDKVRRKHSNFIILICQASDRVQLFNSLFLSKFIHKDQQVEIKINAILKVSIININILKPMRWLVPFSLLRIFWE